jgi:hypothetical protein
MEESDLTLVTLRLAAATTRFACQISDEPTAALILHNLTDAAGQTGMWCSEYFHFQDQAAIADEALQTAEREVVRFRYWLDLLGDLISGSEAAMQTLGREAAEVRELIRAIRRRRGA